MPKTNQLNTDHPRLPAPAASPRAAMLVEVRESALHDHVLFDAMRYQTYSGMKDDPRIAPILELGSVPLTSGQGELAMRVVAADGSARQVTLYIEHLREGTTRAVLFEYEGIFHLWSMASAAALNESNENEFTQILCRTIHRLRPRLLTAANFSRLVRSSQQSNVLALALRGNVDRIDAGGVELDLRTEDSVGWLLFSLFSTIASMERRWIMLRLQAGRVAASRRGEWPWGEYTLPFGYALDEGKRLVPVPELRERVRDMLLVLASDRSPQAMIAALAKVGVPSMRPDRRAKARVSLSMSLGPTGRLALLYSFVPLWVHGEYLQRLMNLHEGETQVAGEPVIYGEGATAGRAGELQMFHRVPLPEGGWAEPEVLQAAADAALAFFDRMTARAQADGRTRGVVRLGEHVRALSRDPELLARTTKVRSYDRPADRDVPVAASTLRRRHGRAFEGLLSGRTWRLGSAEYALEVRAVGSYNLVRLPLATGEGENA